MASPKHKKSRQPGPAGVASREAGQIERTVQANTQFARGQVVRLKSEPTAVGRVVAVRLATAESGETVLLYIAVFQAPGGAAQGWPVLESELEAVAQKDAPRIIVPGTSSAELGAARAARNIIAGKG